MKGIEIAGLQIDIAWQDPERNFERASHWAERAAAGGARLLVLPEMFATGFSMDVQAVTPHAAATRVFLAGLAGRHGCWVLGGYPEAAERDATDRRARNAASLYDPKGEERLRYHKIHPFSLAGEDRHYRGGQRLPSVEIEGLRVTPLICYDLRFGELFRVAAARSDLFVVIANWPEARRAHWRCLLRARAIENQAWVLGVNRVGEGDGLRYAGDSALIDPMGEAHAELARAPGIVAGRVDAGQVRQVRADFSFLADRRPEVYAEL